MGIRKWFLAAGVACLGLVGQVSADVKLPKVFSDHMVLQRDREVPFWGWDNPGAEVKVSIGEKSASAKADKDGKWSVKLPAMKAGGPYKVTVQGSSTVNFSDVLFGEVWLCSGQSNMEWSVSASANPKEEIEKANHPKIRHIKIPHVPADKPQSDVNTNGWQVCTPQVAGGFTAVGYYFALNLQKELDVPIGLIGSNWGGTRIEPWTTPDGFKSVPALKDISDKLATFPTKNDKGVINHQTPLALYNGMISPLVPYAIRGALWYQGESNNGEGMLYFEKMKALINGWRKLWNDESMPFYFVQLAPFDYNKQMENGKPATSGLPYIWEAQAATLKIPNTGMAVTVDITALKDIHPKNKQDVGYTGTGLKTRDGGELKHFQITGADKKWVWAKAKIEGNEVVVWHDDVKQPVGVRYAWAAWPQGANLINAEGLPASCFRTDDFLPSTLGVTSPFKEATAVGN